MKTNLSSLIIFLGIFVVIASNADFVTSKILFASSACTQGCSTTNTKVCYGSNVTPICDCLIQKSGKYWSSNPTYGSTTGSQTVSFPSEHCYSVVGCKTYGDPYNNLICDVVIGLGGVCSKPAFSVQCYNYGTAPAQNYGVSSCKAGGCGEG